MKGIPAIAVLTLSLMGAAPNTATQDLGLPELHRINRVTLEPSYSCRSEQELARGYEHTALFLSAFSRQRNSPELLFEGACKSEDTFMGATAGDDFDVVADYGEWPIEDLTAQQAFSPQMLATVYARFSQRIPVVEGHTYGLLINKRDIRGLLFFQVVRHVANQKVELKYVVKDYQVLDQRAQSQGFAWDGKSYY